MTAAWNTLLAVVAQVTRKMKKTAISERMFKTLLFLLYVNYDISRPYPKQVEENKTLAVDIFKREIHKKLIF